MAEPGSQGLRQNDSPCLPGETKSRRVRPLRAKGRIRMTYGVPIAELSSQFSSPGAMALPWRDAEQHLQQAGVFWLSSVRPDARPHVTPVIAVWLDRALYFCTGADERKAKNLARNAQVVMTT